ncbi:MAG: hypothetical protein JW778_07820 [Candidatus Altiarchaeota archaeon]|nr:hypothetical protein [Candidatus Altiarchaeota archaeon]
MEKKFLVAGFAALLIAGFVVAGATMRGGRPGLPGAPGDHTAMLQDLGLSENSTPEEVREAMFNRRLEELGLTEDSTIKELREAMEAKSQTMGEERLMDLKERLGLSEDATEEDIEEALKEKQGDCKVFGRGRGPHDRGMGLSIYDII